MADAVQLKARVSEYLRRLQADRAAAAKTYSEELDRMDAQIKATQRVLNAWDGKIDDLLGLLTAAGIQVQV